MLNEYSADFVSKLDEWRNSTPFQHLVIDNFLDANIAMDIAKEFPDFESDAWRVYNNPLEIKKLVNHYDKFGPTTYRLFCYLNSKKFIEKLEYLIGEELFPDVGLNGGGLHTHKRGGKLNTHLDYSIHPKLGLERRLNLLIYVTPNWQNDWGGSLGLWSKKGDANRPDKLVHSIAPIFNRAVLFDTTQDSWHGLPEPLTCPDNISRNSLAIYYLCVPRKEVSKRGKALFAPTPEQEGDEAIQILIKKRSSLADAHSVYGDK
jgi:Rps23 Pro-64 3,4-dihydroxylase Tpa1-like proline 4-hydroxylase